MRLWTLLAQVRRLRVERKRRVLNAARLEAERWAAETAEKREAIARHEFRRGEIIAACTARDRAASLWRDVLHRHDGEKSTLDSALSIALRAGQMAELKAVTASRALQKEMSGEDDARARVRRLKAARQNDDDPDD